MGSVLAILDEEEEYVLCLMDYIKNKLDYDFSVIAFTELQAYLDFEKDKNVAVLLFHENMNNEIINSCRAAQKVCLKESNLVPGNIKDKSIFKFQSAEKIMKELYSILAEQKEEFRKVKYPLQTKVLGVFLPFHASFGTNISFALAYELSKHMKTLFISFNPFISSKEMGNVEEIQGLADTIYYCKQKNANFSLKVKTIIGNKDTLDYLLGVFHWSDIAELTEEEGHILLDELKHNLGYECIILDFGELANATNALLDHCEVIYLPYINEEGSYKREELLRQVQLKKGEGFMNKISLFELPHEETRSESYWTSIKEGKYNKLARLFIEKEELLIGE